MTNVNAERVATAYIDGVNKRDAAVRDAAEAILDGRCSSKRVAATVDALADVLNEEGELTEEYQARWREAEACVQAAFDAWCDA